MNPDHGDRGIINMSRLAKAFGLVGTGAGFATASKQFLGLSQSDEKVATIVSGVAVVATAMPFAAAVAYVMHNKIADYVDSFDEEEELDAATANYVVDMVTPAPSGD